MRAVVETEGMKAWIETVPHPKLRRVLAWLHAHAEGGFEAKDQEHHKLPGKCRFFAAERPAVRTCRIYLHHTRTKTSPGGLL